MSADKSYNGWTNYETWAVALWLDNDEGSQDYWQNERAREAYRDEEGMGDKDDRVSNAVTTLADALKDEHDDNTPTVTGVYADLLNAALSEVNWREIARHYIEEIAGADEEEVPT